MNSSSPMLDSRTRQAFYLASGRVLSAVVGLLSFAILSRLLVKSEYATYRQALLIHSIAAPLLMWGLPETLYYFLPREKQRQRGVLVENLLLLSAAGAVFAGFLLCGGAALLAGRFEHPEPGLSTTLVWLAPLALCALLPEAVPPTLLVMGRARQLVGFQVLTRTMLLCGTLLPVLLWQPTGVAATAGMACATVAIFPCAAAIMLAATPGSGRPTMAGAVEQLRYALPLGLSNVLSSWLFSWDKVVVFRSEVCTSEDYAAFANGAWEIPIVGILAASTTSVLWPEMVRLHQDRQPTKMLDLWQRAAVKMSYVVLPLALFGLILAPEIIELLYTRSYADSVPVFRVYLVLAVLRIVSWTVVLQATRQTWAVVGVTLAGWAVMAIVAPWCVREWGILGAAAATAGVMGLVLSPGSAWCTARTLECPVSRLLPWRPLGKSLLLTLLPGPLLAVKLLTPLIIRGTPGLVLILASASLLYFPACYLLLTRLTDCPRIALVERYLLNKSSRI